MSDKEELKDTQAEPGAEPGAEPRAERSITELIKADTYEDMSNEEVAKLIHFKEQQAYSQGLQAAVMEEMRRMDEETLAIQLKAAEASSAVLKTLCAQQVFLEKVNFDNA